MKAKVTKRGLIIPKEMLTGAEVVEILVKNHRIVISAVTKVDPILNLGRCPVECGVSDASMHHDSYLYGSGS